MKQYRKWIKLLITNPEWMFPYLVEKMSGGGIRMDDESYVRLIYKFRNGTELNLKHPKTFTEKLNWMKLHDRQDVYTVMADKYRVKKFVARKIGKEYIIPLLGVWKHAGDIDFEKLPRSFVLKVTHDSGGVLICKDKNDFDYKKARKFLEKRLRQNFAYRGREWPYQNVRPRIIAETYIENLADNNYKFFCFDGEVKALYVAPYREASVDYFDADYNHLDIVTTLHQCAPVLPKKPDSFEKMKQLAEKLSKGYKEMRVDFYDVNGRVYFGEITFFHEAGFEPFIPDKWNRIFGDWMKLS